MTIITSYIPFMNQTSTPQAHNAFQAATPQHPPCCHDAAPPPLHAVAPPLKLHTRIDLHRHPSHIASICTATPHTSRRSAQPPLQTSRQSPPSISTATITLFLVLGFSRAEELVARSGENSPDLVRSRQIWQDLAGSGEISPDLWPNLHHLLHGATI
uniref:Uncharacterized protein n=1 Tax=Fagus sylvatica TaxID=28930 RepID=A0A2N9IPZ3_FAGSY